MVIHCEVLMRWLDVMMMVRWYEEKMMLSCCDVYKVVGRYNDDNGVMIMVSCCKVMR